MDLDSLQTKKELDYLIRDFKRFNTAFRFVALSVYILFVVYCLVIGSGYLALNIVLLVLSVAYLVFVAVCTVRQAKGMDSTKADKIAAKIYHWSKFVTVCVSAVLSVAGILTAVEHTTSFSIILAILLPVCLVLQVLFDLAIVWITARVKRFQFAFTQDMEVLKRDMVKLAIGLVKDSLFKRNREELRSDANRNGDGDIIVVGSDEPVSVKAMKRVGEPAPKRGNVFSRAFKKIFKGKKEKKNPPTLPAWDEGETENE